MSDQSHRATGELFVDAVRGHGSLGGPPNFAQLCVTGNDDLFESFPGSVNVDRPVRPDRTPRTIMSTADKKRLRRYALRLSRTGFRPVDIAVELGLSERTIRRYIERAKLELADDFMLRGGDGLVGDRAEVDDLLRANLRMIETLRERGNLSVREELALLRERRAVAETLMRLTGSAEMMQ